MRNCEATRPDLGGSNDETGSSANGLVWRPPWFSGEKQPMMILLPAGHLKRKQMEKSSTSWAMFHSYDKSPEATISYVNQNLIVSGCEVTGGEHRHVG